MNNFAEFKQQYQQGKKEFINFNLREADFKGINLSYLDLRGCNLIKANLTEVCLDEANLDNANLTEAILDRASLIKTRLNQANLTKASLIKTKLVRASLNEANLSQANFSNAFLTISCLDKTLLTGASFQEAAINGASFQEADLTDASFLRASLRHAKFNLSYYNFNTLFDSNFDPIEAGMQKIISIEDITTDLLTETFTSLCQLGQHYLGIQMITKYWQSSRPDFDWLKQFQINNLGQVTFIEENNQPVNQENIKYYKKWLDAFIKSCSLIIQDFPKIVNEKELIAFELEEILKQIN